MEIRAGACAATVCLVLVLGGCAALDIPPAPAPAPEAGEPAALDASDTRTTTTYLEVAELREDAGDWSGALARVDKALAYQPRSRTALLRRAQLLLLGGGDIEEAREIVARAGESEDAELLVTRAWLAHAGGRGDAAVAGAHDALAGAGDSARVHWLAARLLVAHGESAAASDAASRALALDPGPGAALRERAHAQIRRADFVAATLDLGDQLRRFGDDPEARALEAELFLRMGAFGPARQALERIPAARRDAAATAALAHREVQAGDLAAARALLEPAVAARPADARLLDAMLALDEREGRAGESVARADAALAAQPEDAATARLRARALAAARSDEAGAAFARAIALDPNDTSAYEALSAWLGTAGDAERRIAALGLDPAPALVATGFARAARGDAAGAAAAHQQAIEADPALAIARASLARALATSGGDAERALALAREAHAARPADPDFAWTLGLAHARRGQSKAAFEALRVAVGSYPVERRGYAELAWNTAQALERAGDRGAARGAAQAALAWASARQGEPGWLASARALAGS
jgi:predicted Zn-dependent protease